MNPEYPGTPEPAPRRRAGTVALAVAGWLVLAAATAGAVVAVGSGGSPRTVADPAASPSAARPTGGAKASVTPSPSPTTASPTPSPSATVKGSVSGNTHSGDLRYFLLPVPDGDQVEGDPNGVAQSLGDVAKEMDNPSTSRRILNDLGCQGGAYRSFVTNDGVWTVTVHLIHFDGSGHASDWVSGLTFANGHSFHVSGISDATGQSIDPSSSNGGNGLLIGVSHVGDVEYEVDVTGAGSPSRSLLTQLMQRQEQRLTTGV
ncbi:hypothetical protein [Streptacidiphilus jiangxiensis]|uniref:Uncharacterized protein n=1 Tax=Streptacidiphilus jiangxiensis TaxID=235985 RepID=A0A1H7J4U9_STRJI|nr:hypothetical protein [Streptacidiphilus jiangxiensis]SEK69698.1 hypothetical protein SAMN05414137_103147 [Streptacidiphilus jiangxiensis]